MCESAFDISAPLVGSTGTLAKCRAGCNTVAAMLDNHIGSQNAHQVLQGLATSRASQPYNLCCFARIHFPVCIGNLHSILLVYYLQVKCFDVFDSKEALEYHIFQRAGASNDDLKIFALELLQLLCSVQQCCYTRVLAAL